MNPIIKYMILGIISDCIEIDGHPRSDFITETLDSSIHRMNVSHPSSVMVYTSPDMRKICKNWADGLLFCKYVDQRDSPRRKRSSGSPRLDYWILQMLDQCTHIVVFLRKRHGFSQRIVTAIMKKSKAEMYVVSVNDDQWME